MELRFVMGLIESEIVEIMRDWRYGVDGNRSEVLVVQSPLRSSNRVR